MVFQLTLIGGEIVSEIIEIANEEITENQMIELENILNPSGDTTIFAKFGRTGNIDTRKTGRINNSTDDTYQQHIDHHQGKMIEIGSFSGTDHHKEASKVEKFFNEYKWRDITIVDGGRGRPTNTVHVTQTYLYYFSSRKIPAFVVRSNMRTCTYCEDGVDEYVKCKREGCRSKYCHACKDENLHAGGGFCVKCKRRCSHENCHVDDCTVNYDQRAAEEVGDYDTSQYNRDDDDENDECDD